MEKLEFPRVGEQSTLPGAGQRTAYLCGAQARLSEELRLFATNYGGMDMKFKLDGQDMDTPAGVAPIWSTRCSTPRRATPSRSWRPTAPPQCLHQQRHHRLLFREHREIRGEPAHPALLRLHSLFHQGERGQGAGDHRSGDRHDRGRPGLGGLYGSDAGPLREAPGAGVGGGLGGVHLPHHR